MARARTQRSNDIWPGFVDALSTLLLAIIFLLVVFMLAQFFLSQALLGRDEALARLTRQVSELGDLLSLERQANTEMRLNIAQLSASLQDSAVARDALTVRFDELSLEYRQMTARAETAETKLSQAGEQLAAEEAERVRMSLRLDELVLDLDDMTARAEGAEAGLSEAQRTIAADRETIELQVGTLARLRNDVAELRDLRNRLEESLNEAQRTITADRETIEVQVLELARLKQDVAALRDIRARLEESLKEAERTIEADKATVELQLRELVSLKADVDSLRLLRRDLEAEVGRLAGALDDSRDAAAAARDRSAELEARLDDERERTLLAQKTIEEREIGLAELRERAAEVQADLAAERDLSARANDQISVLNQQVQTLRQQLQRLEAALEVSEALDAEQKSTIVDLGRRLNLALARKVEELSRYRSEFFGRLREVLGERRDITIVGDRFVFQSEVLFASGSAELGAEGQIQLAALARTLLEIAARIPADIPWVLRIDGHTDKIPISTFQFPSNWELSTARAISVTRFLISEGIPSERIAAAGFAEFQPLDPRDDEIAYRRNRRIELKLTER